MTLSALRDDVLQKILVDLVDNPKMVRDRVAYLADLQQSLSNSSQSGATAAEIKSAIETATNIDTLEALLAAVRDRLVASGPALNLGAVNGQTQRVVDAASLFTTTNVGNYDGTFTTTGTSALAAQNIQSIDLTGVGRSEFALSLTCTGNATAPGAASTITFYYAFSPDLGATVGQFRGFTTLPVISLANLANFINRFTTQRIVPNAAIFYLWFDRSALPAGTTISIQARISNT
jgi:hypothetical protein